MSAPLARAFAAPDLEAERRTPRRTSVSTYRSISRLRDSRCAGEARLARHHRRRGESVGLAADLDALAAARATWRRSAPRGRPSWRRHRRCGRPRRRAGPRAGRCPARGCANGRCSAPGASGTSTLRRPRSRRAATSKATSSLDPAQVTSAVAPSGVIAMRIGTPGNGSRAITASDAVSTIATWPSARAATQSSRPSGVSASASEPPPVTMSPSLRPAARSSAVVVPDPMFVT